MKWLGVMLVALGVLAVACVTACTNTVPNPTGSDGGPGDGGRPTCVFDSDATTFGNCVFK